MNGSGSSDSYGAGAATFVNGQFKIPMPPSTVLETEDQRGRIQWQFHAGIGGPNTTTSDGFMVGGLFAKVKWPNNPTTIFKSGCVQEIGTDSEVDDTGKTLWTFEGEWEGLVENFPGVSGGPYAAIGSITVNTRGEGRFSLELGTTCNQFTKLINSGEKEYEFSMGFRFSPSSEMVRIARVNTARWAFPVGKAPEDCPFEAE